MNGASERLDRITAEYATRQADFRTISRWSNLPGVVLPPRFAVPSLTLL
jgi:hypothetical protein